MIEATEGLAAAKPRRGARATLAALLPPACLMVALGTLCFLLLRSHMLERRPEGLYSGGSTWGDLAWHLSMISNFMERGFLTAREDPVFAGTKLSYPFLPDMLSARLLRLGISLQASLIWPTLAAFLCAVAGMYWFARKVIRSSYEAMLVPLLFFFNGSIVGCYYFWQDFRRSGVSFVSFINHLPRNYVNLFDRNLTFTNVMSDYVLPQRAMVFGFALGMVAIEELWQYWERGGKNHLFYAGLIVSLLPLVHFHSFVALTMAAALLFFLDLGHQPKGWRRIFAAWASFAFPLGVIALPQAVWISPRHAGSFLRWQLGWMSHNEPAELFWLRNLSPHLFVFAAAFFVVESRFRRFWAAFIGVFIIANIVVFQPFDYDNMKLMLWPFLISCVGTAASFALFRRRYAWPGIAGSLLLTLLMVASGCLAVYREMGLHWLMFSTEDLRLADYVRKQTPRDAIFLTSDKHNHPIPCLAGRRIVMGFRGWLWTHGIDYRLREHDVLLIYQGLSGIPDLLNKYNISYVLLERDRVKDFPQNALALRLRFPVVFEGWNYELLKVKQEPAQAPRQNIFYKTDQGETRVSP